LQAAVREGELTGATVSELLCGGVYVRECNFSTADVVNGEFSDWALMYDVVFCELWKIISPFIYFFEKYVKHLIHISCVWMHCIVGKTGADGWVNSQGTRSM